ncbi:unnamed protein product, partial [Owenia fusiformis]
MHCLQQFGGVLLSLWVFAVIVLALVPKTESITTSEKQAIKKGLQTGKEIFDLIKEQKFHETLTKVATNVKGFLGALGPFIGLVMAFVPAADSAELEFMKKMMDEINTHFERVDSRFNDIERLIKWAGISIQFGEIQASLEVLTEEYRLFYSSSAPEADRKSLFMKSYDDNYNLAGTRLYLAVVTQQGYFNENLGQAVMRYTKYDRKMTEYFLLGILDMILQAIILELGYYEMNMFTEIKQERETEWNTRLNNLRLKYEQIDEDVKNRYHIQSKEEILEYARDNTGMSNEQLSSGLFSLLEKKYYWRVWFVLVYDPITASSKHKANVCGGHILFGQYGRNIVVASKDKAQPKMELRKALQELQKFYVYIVPAYYGDLNLLEVFYNGQKAIDSYDAGALYNMADKTSSCSFAVVDKDANAFYKSSANRAV